MVPNNNHSVLPWYSDTLKQNHLKSYVEGVYPLFTPDRKFLPFQIVRDTRANAITNVSLYQIDGTLFLDVTAAALATGLQVKRFQASGYDLIIYPGILPMAVDTPEGRYYATLTDGVDTWYSEVFTVVRSLSDMLKIEWFDVEPMYWTGGHMDYTPPYRNVVYLPTEVGRPDYDFSDVVVERGGHSFIEQQISEKKYHFNFVAPEYLCDALRLIRMSDYITITSKGESYTVETFLMTVKWLEGGALASVEAEFECDTVVKKIGRGVVPVTLGDFNDDHNDDFNITDV